MLADVKTTKLFVNGVHAPYSNKHYINILNAIIFSNQKQNSGIRIASKSMMIEYNKSFGFVLIRY